MVFAQVLFSNHGDSMVLADAMNHLSYFFQQTENSHHIAIKCFFKYLVVLQKICSNHGDCLILADSVNHFAI